MKNNKYYVVMHLPTNTCTNAKARLAGPFTKEQAFSFVEQHKSVVYSCSTRFCSLCNGLHIVFDIVKTKKTLGPYFDV